MYTQAGSFMDCVEEFDPGFFNLTSTEASFLDPAQRLLLETSWEALENSNISPLSLSGTNTGVFLGGPIWSDYGELLSTAQDQVGGEYSAYIETGNSLSTASGRISYFLNLTGRTTVIDTACSSSSVSSIIAAESLRSGDTDLALSGSCNVILSPKRFINFCRSKMLSSDGRCKSYDISCYETDKDGGVNSGFGRAEGVAVIVMKRLSDAIKSKDRILAVIRGHHINSDAASNGLTAPSKIAQEKLILKGLQNAGLTPGELDFLEGHGSGTSLGDSIELGAISNVFKDRTIENPLILGSVKANIGHAECCSGLAAIVKVLLTFKNHVIPPHRNFTKLNPHIEDNGKIKILTSRHHLEKGVTVKAGISNFGFSGTNGFLVLESYAQPEPEDQMEEESVLSDRPVHIYTVSTRSEKVLLKHLDAHKNNIEQSGDKPFQDYAYTSTVCRSHFTNRVAVIARDSGEFVSKVNSCQYLSHSFTEGHVRKLIFLFPGIESVEAESYRAAGIELYESQPFFRASMDEAASLLANELEVPLMELYSHHAAEGPQDPKIQELALICVSVSLSKLWSHFGIKPDVVFGVGIGEYAAAVTAGVMGLKEAIHLILTRHKLGLPSDNSPDSIENFREIASRISFAKPIYTVVSSARGQILNEVPDESYWAEHAREGAKLQDAFGAIGPQELTFLEIGPKSSLLDIAQEKVGIDAQYLRTLEPLSSDWTSLLQSMAQLYVNGINPQFEALEAPYPRTKVRLPTITFDRKRVWAKSLDALQQKQRLKSSIGNESKSKVVIIHPLLGSRVASTPREVIYEGHIDWNPGQACLSHHRVCDRVILPAAGFVELGIALAKDSGSNKSLVNLSIDSPLILQEGSLTKLQVLLTQETSTFEIHSSSGTEENNWTCHARGQIGGSSHSELDQELKDIPKIQARLQPMDLEEVYQRFKGTGITYGPNFRLLEGLWVGDGEALAQLKSNHDSDLGYKFHPAVLDNAFQAFAIGSALEDGTNGLYLPVSVAQVTLRSSLNKSNSPKYALATWETGAPGEVARGNISLLDSDGEILAQITDFTTKRTSAQSFSKIIIASEAKGPESGFYQYIWRKSPELSSRLQIDPMDLQEISDLCQNFQVNSKPLQKIQSSYSQFEGPFHRLALNFVLQAFHDLGFNIQDIKSPLGESSSNGDWSSKGISSQHFPLVRTCIRALQKDYLEDPLHIWENNSWPSPELIQSSIQKYYNLIRESHPEQEIALELVSRCGEGLASVLRGHQDPLEFLFPKDPADPVNAMAFYRDSPQLVQANLLLEQVMERILSSIPPGQSLRILEVGAGTGSTTAFVLKVLAASGIPYEFTYTDASNSFFPAARLKFKEYEGAGLQFFRVLNVEDDPGAQGFELFNYDMVLGSNIVHATRILRESLTNLRSLLRPSGILLLCENTVQALGIDISFGLTPGWFRFKGYSDPDRTDHPLLSCPEWDKILRTSGFEDVATVELYHSLVIARADAGFSLESSPSPWLIIGEPQEELVKTLSSTLRQGGEVVEVTSSPILTSGQGYKGIAFAMGLEETKVEDDLDENYMKEYQERVAGSALNFLQGLCVSGSEIGTKLVLVTHRAVTVHHQEKVLSPFGASLWGMSRSFRREEPGIPLITIDLDREISPSMQIPQLLNEFWKKDEESEVVLRGNERFVLRLTDSSLSLNNEENTSRILEGAESLTLQIPSSNLIKELTLTPTTRVKSLKGTQI